MAGVFQADLAGMQAWAGGIMASRPPDFVIGDDYLRRWWVIPRNPFCNVYLHEIRKSDDDRALHDHPWSNTSLLLEGQYREHTPEGIFLRVAGDVVERPASALHRLECVDGQQALSLFITGPKVREWGFDCPHGWVHWADFTDPQDPGKQGKGCGEPEAENIHRIPGTMTLDTAVKGRPPAAATAAKPSSADALRSASEGFKQK